MILVQGTFIKVSLILWQRNGQSWAGWWERQGAAIASQQSQVWIVWGAFYHERRGCQCLSGGQQAHPGSVTTLAGGMWGDRLVPLPPTAAGHLPLQLAHPQPRSIPWLSPCVPDTAERNCKFKNSFQPCTKQGALTIVCLLYKVGRV